MRRLRLGVAAASSLVLAFSACGGTTTSKRSAVHRASANRFEDFDPHNFDDTSTTVDNRYFPLQPGTQYVYEGFTLEEGKRTPHRVVFTVTDLVKEIDGVRAVVIWDRDFRRDDLEESELTFFAQDRSGTVWHLGQYREMYEGKELSGGRAWMVGHLKGARAGIFMQADPRPGTPSYSQGYAPAPFYWTDRARISQVGRRTTVPFGTYEDVIVTEEFNDQEPGAFQLKYYAPDVGNVRVGWRGNDAEQETLELTDVKRLGSDDLAKVRAAALELETRANVYGSTPPAQPRAGATGS